LAKKKGKKKKKKKVAVPMRGRAGRVK